MKDLLGIVFVSMVLSVFLVLICEPKEIKEEEETAVEQVDNYIIYTLIPQRYGLDTLCIKAQSVEELMVTRWFLDQTSQVETNYIVFIENNKIKTAVNKRDYQLKID
jgi:3,4-dihydroxy-2-butanone 4-phosphate synthase